MSFSTVLDSHAFEAGSAGRALPRPLIYLIFFLSGASALVYQTAWQRLLGLFSGSDTIAATIVVGAFLLGLGLGSLWGAVLADRLSRRGAIGAFAWCEVGIAAFAALSPTLFYDVLFGQLIGLAGRTDLVIGVTFISLLPPTLLMGLSLPLLARAMADEPETIAVEVGLLYGLNTLGAAIGTFLAGWVVLGTIGYAATIYAGVALNLLVALGAWVARRGIPAGLDRPAELRPRVREAGARVWYWSGLVFASGFLIIALEIVWFRLLGVMMQGNAYAFSLVLAVFLLGDALGIVAGVAIVRHLRDLRRSFLLLQGAMAAYALLSALVLHAAHGTFGGFVGWTDGYFASLPALFAVIGLTLAVVLPPAFLLGMSFPVAQAAVQDDPGLVGQRVGVIQLFNILGNAAGALVAGLLLLHWFGTVGTLRVVGLAAALLLVPALRAWRGPGRAAWGELRLAGVLALLVAALPANDRFWARLHGAADADVTFAAEDRTGVAVFRREEQDWGLYIGGYRQSHAPFHSYQVSLGLIGVTLHPDPKSVLVIGQGTGGTPYGAGANPLTEQISVVEIVGPVYEVAEELAAHSGDPGLNRYLADPRYRRVVGDGRHALFSDARTYDVIEADAIYPHGSRAGMLYSVEHFRLILSRLNPGGLYLQWRASPNTERTFRAAFPHTVVLSNNMLLGSNRPIEVDVEAFRAKVFGPVRPYLERAGIDPELTMLDLGEPLRVEGPGDDRPRARLNTDLFPRDEYYLNSPLSF